MRNSKEFENYAEIRTFNKQGSEWIPLREIPEISLEQLWNIWTNRSGSTSQLKSNEFIKNALTLFGSLNFYQPRIHSVYRYFKIAYFSFP